jgi:hypothetical protein
MKILVCNCVSVKGELTQHPYSEAILYKKTKQPLKRLDHQFFFQSPIQTSNFSPCRDGFKLVGFLVKEENNF